MPAIFSLFAGRFSRLRTGTPRSYTAAPLLQVLYPFTCA